MAAVVLLAEVASLEAAAASDGFSMFINSVLTNRKLVVVGSRYRAWVRVDTGAKQ